MTTIDLGFRPRPWQRAVFKQKKRFSVLAINRRAGKTVAAVMRLIDEALRCQRERGRYAYIAPFFRQAKAIAWDYLKHYALKVPGCRLNESEMWVEFANGARIRLYGADDPDALRGLYFDGVVLDEVAHMKREVWTEILMPALSDRLGWAMFIGTPKGTNLFTTLFLAAEHDPDWFALKLTCYETMEPVADEVERMKRDMLDHEFRQEMLCDFETLGERVFRNVRECATGEPEKPNAGQRYVIGVDLGQYRDFTVLWVKDRALRTVHVERFNSTDWGIQKIRIIECADAYNRARCYVDATHGSVGDVIVGDLQKSGVDAEAICFTPGQSGQRWALIRNLAIMMERKRLTLIRPDAGQVFSTAIDELESYEYSETDAGRLTHGAPDGRHDDCVMALALAAWGLRETPNAGRAKMELPKVEMFSRPVQILRR